MFATREPSTRFAQLVQAASAVDDIQRAKQPPYPTSNGRDFIDIENDQVLIDSGATDHLHPNKADLRYLEEDFHNIYTADGRALQSTHSGTLCLRLRDIDTNRYTNLALANTICLPGITHTLWSVIKFAEEGHQMIFADHNITIVLHAYDDTRRQHFRIRNPMVIAMHQPPYPLQVNQALVYRSAAVTRPSITESTAHNSTNRPQATVTHNQPSSQPANSFPLVPSNPTHLIENLEAMWSDAIQDSIKKDLPSLLASSSPSSQPLTFPQLCYPLWYGIHEDSDPTPSLASLHTFDTYYLTNYLRKYQRQATNDAFIPPVPILAQQRPLYWYLRDGHLPRSFTTKTYPNLYFPWNCPMSASELSQFIEWQTGDGLQISAYDIHEMNNVASRPPTTIYTAIDQPLPAINMDFQHTEETTISESFRDLLDNIEQSSSSPDDSDDHSTSTSSSDDSGASTSKADTEDNAALLDKLQNIAQAAQRIQPYFVNKQLASRHEIISKEICSLQRRLFERDMSLLSPFTFPTDFDVWLRLRLVGRTAFNIYQTYQFLGDLQGSNCPSCRAPLNALCQCTDRLAYTVTNTSPIPTYDAHDIAYARCSSHYIECNSNIFTLWSYSNKQLFIQDPFSTAEDLLVCPLTLDAIRAAQDESYFRSQCAHSRQCYMVWYDSREYEHTGLYHECHHNRILLPPSLHQKLFTWLHQVVGHIGTQSILTIIEQIFYWPCMPESFSQWLSHSCLVCKFFPGFPSSIVDQFFNPKTQSTIKLTFDTKWPYEATISDESNKHTPKVISPLELLTFACSGCSLHNHHYDLSTHPELPDNMDDIPELQWDYQSQPRRTLANPTSHFACMAISAEHHWASILKHGVDIINGVAYTRLPRLFEETDQDPRHDLNLHKRMEYTIKYKGHLCTARVLESLDTTIPFLPSPQVTELEDFPIPYDLKPDYQDDTLDDDPWILKEQTRENNVSNSTISNANRPSNYAYGVNIINGRAYERPYPRHGPIDTNSLTIDDVDMDPNHHPEATKIDEYNVQDTTDPSNPQKNYHVDVFQVTRAPSIPQEFSLAANITARPIPNFPIPPEHALPPRSKRETELDLVHNRLGHINTQSLIAGNAAEIWGDTKLVMSPEKFCIGCKIGSIRKSNRGHNVVSNSTSPGSILFCDIQTNPTSQGLTERDYFPYFLSIACSYSKYFALIGMKRIRTNDVIDALHEFCINHRPYSGYSVNSIEEIHADAGSQFLSDMFQTWASTEGRNIRIIIAAPEHQHQNGTIERPYQTNKMITNRLLAHARLPNKFYTRASLTAAKIMNYLPHKGVFTNGRTGDPCTPFQAYYSRKPNIQKLRVFGCPCIVKIYHRRSFDKKSLTIKNNFQRGIRGIHVGQPDNQAGWLIYIPSSGHLLVSGDVAFDEHFTSTLDYGHLTFHDALPLRSPGAHADPTLPSVRMSPPSVTGFSNYLTSADDEPFDTFDYENPENLYSLKDMVIDDIAHIPDDDLSPNERDQLPTSSLDPSDSNSSNIHEGYSRINEGHTSNDDDSYASDSSIFQEGALSPSNYSAEAGPDLDNFDTLNDVDFDTTIIDAADLEEDVPPTTYDDSGPPPSPPPPRRSARIRTRQEHGLYTRVVNSVIAMAMFTATCVRELQIAAKILKDTIVFPKDLGEPGSDPTYFIPEPRSLADIKKMPPQMRDPWIKASRAEIKGLISRNTFTIEDAPKGVKAPMLMFVFKCKTNKFGFLDKLKARAVFRGDLIPHEDVCTWNPHASWPALKCFLAYASFIRAPIRQYDFIQAYLQVSISEPLYCRISELWIPFLPPELHKYCGPTLRSNKALYGWHRSGQHLWQAVEEFLDSFGLKPSSANQALWFLHDGDSHLAVLQYSDDGIFCCNDPELEKRFTAELKKSFDCNVTHQADWYLQSHITQDKDFNTTLDQQRYCLSMLRRFLPNLPEKPTASDTRKYLNPCPADFTWSKHDRSKTQADVEALETEFGFRYIEAVGSLNWLSNTAFKQLFAIRKACKFMNLPGKPHFEAVRHLLMHLWCHPPQALKFYSDAAKAPVAQLLKDAGHPTLDPFYLFFTDSSFSDCDDSRSTGGYVILLQGGIVDMNSFVPAPIAQSTCEAESNAQCVALMASRHVTKMVMELFRGGNSEYPYTIPLLTDNKSSLSLATSDKRTKSSRHIERRFQYVRHSVLSGYTILYHINGKDFQLADIVTKPLSHHESMNLLAYVEAVPHGHLDSMTQSSIDEGCCDSRASHTQTTSSEFTPGSPSQTFRAPQANSSSSDHRQKHLVDVTSSASSSSTPSSKYYHIPTHNMFAASQPTVVRTQRDHCSFVNRHNDGGSSLNKSVLNAATRTPADNYR
jgi:hypothetical protein